jgi:3-methyladenine DNA glycosylase AlkD
VSLLATLRAALAHAADPKKAPAMQRYMKSSMPYLGVTTPRMRVVCKEVFAAHPVTTAAGWRRDVLTLWRGARHREERYAAIALSGDRRAREFQTPAVLPMYEEMIVTGAWWDYVDEIASHRLGGLLRSHPRPMRTAMRTWSRSPDMWKRRSAILCQLGFKGETDAAFLYACIEPSLASTEFFLRKAIGWALRQYAWTNPREVVRWVDAHRDELSPLSRREALKNVSGRRQSTPVAQSTRGSRRSPAWTRARRRTSGRVGRGPRGDGPGSRRAGIRRGACTDPARDG